MVLLLMLRRLLLLMMLVVLLVMLRRLLPLMMLVVLLMLRRLLPLMMLVVLLMLRRLLPMMILMMLVLLMMWVLVLLRTPLILCLCEVFLHIIQFYYYHPLFPFLYLFQLLILQFLPQPYDFYFVSCAYPHLSFSSFFVNLLAHLNARDRSQVPGYYIVLGLRRIMPNLDNPVGAHLPYQSSHHNGVDAFYCS